MVTEQLWFLKANANLIVYMGEKMLFVKKEITPKKRFQQVLLYWDLLFLSCIDCSVAEMIVYIYHIISVLDWFPSCRLQLMCCYSAVSCSVARNTPVLISRIINLSTFASYGLLLAVYLFIFLSIKGMWVDNAASNVSKPCTFIFFTAHSNKSGWLSISCLLPERS